MIKILPIRNWLFFLIVLSLFKDNTPLFQPVFDKCFIAAGSGKIKKLLLYLRRKMILGYKCSICIMRILIPLPGGTPDEVKSA